MKFISLIISEGLFCGHHLGVTPRAATTSLDLTVPPGFILLTKPSPFLAMLGPVYTRGMGTSMVMGFHVQHHHLNRRGIPYGGVVTSLADTALGYYPAEPGEDTGGVLAMSAASLTVDFIASAGEGDRIEITPEGLRTGSRLAFAQALSHHSDQLTAHASAVSAMSSGYV